MSKKKDVVIRLLASHPTGVRRRCGYVFGTKPTLVSVTKEELETILADKYLVLVEKGLALETGKANPQTKAGEDSEPETETETGEETETGDDSDDEDSETETGGDDEGDVEVDDSDDELTLESLMDLKKPELVEVAKAAGLEIKGDPNKEEIANLILSNTQE